MNSRPKLFPLIKKHSYKIPNKAELLILGILSLYKLPFEYTGQGTYVIGNKIPDFVSIKNKQIIELFGKHWHPDAKEGVQRTQFFKSAGFDTLIIYDTELTARNLGHVVNKILNFVKKRQVDSENL